MGAKILVIDDDLALVRSLGRTFDFCGFETLNAPDGMMGVQMALRHKPDLILMELHFPSGGALFVLKNLRQSLITREIPILIVTSSTDSEAKKRLLDFGIQTYLQKPCDRGELLAHILVQMGDLSSLSVALPASTVVTTGDFPNSSTSSRPATPNTSNRLTS